MQNIVNKAVNTMRKEYRKKNDKSCSHWSQVDGNLHLSQSSNLSVEHVEENAANSLGNFGVASELRTIHGINNKDFKRNEMMQAYVLV